MHVFRDLADNEIILWQYEQFFMSDLDSLKETAVEIHGIPIE